MYEKKCTLFCFSFVLSNTVALFWVSAFAEAAAEAAVEGPVAGVH